MHTLQAKVEQAEREKANRVAQRERVRQAKADNTERETVKRAAQREQDKAMRNVERARISAQPGGKH